VSATLEEREFFAKPCLSLEDSTLESMCAPLERRTPLTAVLSAATHAPVRLAVRAMATRFEIVLGGESAARLRAAGEAALQEIVDCHRRFTRFAPDSLLSHIVRTADRRPVRLDRDSFEMFRDALTIQEATGGAFSISMTPEPAFALDPEACAIRLLRCGITLDLGAIAKGHALELAARSLREAGVSCALLHGGTSSVIAIGTPPGSSGWGIGLAHAPALGQLMLRDRALSVSSTYGATGMHAHRRHLEDGRDGGVSLPPRFAVVAGPCARGADAWATAIAILGERPASLGAQWSTWMSPADARSYPA
jgi:thiamine biosynthesis lipoprotein